MSSTGSLSSMSCDKNTRSTGSLSSNMPGDKKTGSKFEGRLDAGRILRELSESVLKTLTQIEPTSTHAQDQQYQVLLRARCQELKQYVETHPIDSNLLTTTPAPDRKSWMDEQTALEDEEGSNIQSWLTSSRALSNHHDTPYSSRFSSLRSDSEQQPCSTSSSLNLMSAARYKTEMCRSVSEGGGVCRYGDKCQYAHSRSELRPMPRHPRYKTQMCREYHLTSVCSYGVRCNFLHDEHKKPVVVASKPPIDDFNEVFSQQGTWSGRSSPDELTPWTTSTKGLGSTGDVHSPSIDSPESSPLWVSSPIPSENFAFAQYGAFTPPEEDGLVSRNPSTDLRAEFSLFPTESVWNCATDNNFFQFPSSRTFQMQSIGEYDPFGNRF